MFKTNNRISHEAEQLYSQHKKIANSIEENKDHMEAMRQAGSQMAKNALDNYTIELNSEIAETEYDIYLLNKKTSSNQQAAEKHLSDNPRLVNIAVKEAKKDGVDIKL